ncbi:YbhB/YbcL family Raf kinase inhibitor-like protein [Caballeronia sp. LZ065]|uniref:YbhB/YbcL family Raf kinase inhibitor-like protein n=1 Tax=Caballeronia sp. LZ065 TaxID=3038571 RepID=UPI002864E7C8|nr:YbhB/YbcL family Raf kinase inhibitor-like protein [Caballeronia sp. LZ065]MDR5777826.1 YbhB/YbcL family Raf kinase inhibitor-like protein [Caballeronia sp. LZ065]
MRLTGRSGESSGLVASVLFILGAAAALPYSRAAAADTAFTVTSADLAPGKPIGRELLFDQAGCTGGNRSPQISWRGAPANARSFAVTIFDPDAPGRGWWHWAVAGIPGGTERLPNNASASGVLRKMGAIEARNDWDTDGYGGPCPPPGKAHRYVVTVYALDSNDLRLRQGTPALMFEHEIRTMAIATAQLTFSYGR